MSVSLAHRTTKQSGFHRFRRKFSIWLHRSAFLNWLTFALIILAFVCGVMTIGVLTAGPSLATDPKLIITLLYIDLFLLMSVVILISRRIIRLWASRKRGVAGSRLHVKLVFILSILVAVPSILTTIFSISFFSLGVQGWFSDRVSTAINESLEVAEAYLNEHQQIIRADMQALATDLDRQAAILSLDQQAMERMLNTQATLRNFSEIYLLREDNSVLAQASTTFGPAPAQTILPYDFQRANEGDAILLSAITTENYQDSRIRALVKLENYVNAYVFGTRVVDQKVINHLDAARRGVEAYHILEGQSVRIQILMALMFIVVTLIMMFGAIWFGLVLARRLVNPISKLITVAERVRLGDLSARIDSFETGTEFETLGRAFNRMTTQIETQRNELITANRQLDYRRRFTETVLGAISSGVITINDKLEITLANNSAATLLYYQQGELVGKTLYRIMPECVEYIEQVFAAPDASHQSRKHQVLIRDREGRYRTFMMEITLELIGETDQRAVITFDDITQMIHAQKKAAWADVARRIAHEIKNPLTPIQLSAERLNMKYGHTLDNEKDREIFEKCISTITHHVASIQGMVNAFSDFAKMPDPQFEQTNILKLSEDVLSFHKEAHPEVSYELMSSEKSEDVYEWRADPNQIRQVLINLLKNSYEALEEVDEKRIGLLLDADDTSLWIAICDTGIGFPKSDDIQKLTEPYVTHKEKGTGLGLAIVRKIVEDHSGEMIFDPKEDKAHFVLNRWSGAKIILKFNLSKKDS